MLYSIRSILSNNTDGACRFGWVGAWVSDFFSVCLSGACLLGAVDACLCDVMVYYLVSAVLVLVCRLGGLTLEATKW